ncbi:MAG: TM0106 family RecB-like putative nuclease [Burkholderiaceae bacterium]|nr:TM0106 family RecB-like putative nuclease [Microbacteriaceae bacterium]
MFLLDTTVVTSASDLTTASKCEFAFLRTLDAKLGRIPRVAEAADAMLDRTARLGDAHEERVLDGYRAQHGAGVVEIDRPNPLDRASLALAAVATERAFLDRADVVFQATFFDGTFLGFADFIVHTGEGVYEVQDTKLARSAKITALLQLAAYADQLNRLGVTTAEEVRLVLGDGSHSVHRLRDILPVYLNRRARLERLVAERQTDERIVAWGDPRYTACGHCAACLVEVESHRDVLLVAGMRLSQRKKLRDAGVETIEQLAATSAAIPGMAETTLTTLREQARQQLRPGLSFDVFNPAGLGSIPVPDAGDIFFDFEGDPLHSENNSPDWGLDYLFGLVEGDGGFRAFWAHTFAEERQALVDFLDYVAARRAIFPALHIYHYASYEHTHLLSLAARHGYGEEAVDDLLRENVLVDLYPIVKKSLRVGSHSYSIKKLEPLYMGGELRTGVDNAADSITEYARSCELLAEGRADDASAKLDDIARYNEYDCLSTLRLRDWLLARAAENRVDLADARSLELDLPVRQPSPVYLALASAVENIPPADRTADDTAIALASAAIDYHRREGKKFWQEHFARLANPVDAWADTRGVLIAGSVRVHRDWRVEPRARLASRILAITGEVAPGSSFKVGTGTHLLYDAPFPPLPETGAPGSRRAHDRAVIIEIGLTDDGVDEYFVIEKLTGEISAYDELPMALAPGAPPRAGTQVDAIAEWGQEILDALPGMLPDAALDILRLRSPRGTLASVGAIAHDSRGGEITAAIRDSLLSINDSYLAVQGPPGTGKTYTGSRVIADLVVNHGWKVGVVAQSHATVENMLGAVIEAGRELGLGRDRVGKKAKDTSDRTPVPWTTLGPKDFAVFCRQDGFVLGGTAWDFSNAGRVPRGSLDLLVVDEAGQFSLASTIASAVAARRLLLLGDPQQLPQVSQGSHPEPVDVSALGWLTSGHQVLPPEFGFFLEKTFRMHPAVCAPVSRLSYEDKLFSVAETRELGGITPGLHPQPVSHRLNSTSSAEEAERVVEIARSLIGRDWTARGITRAIDEPDIIVVAPYNAQVDLIGQALRAAGLGGIPVGTVDKFQGQEAAVAIVSLSASSAEEVPRGLEFLLLANRLNVAISRAQWAAYLVYSPALTEHLPTNAATLAQLSAFIELVEGVR